MTTTTKQKKAAKKSEMSKEEWAKHIDSLRGCMKDKWKKLTVDEFLRSKYEETAAENAREDNPGC